MWLLWLAGKYVLATRGREFLEEKVSTYPTRGRWPEEESLRQILRRCYDHLVEATGCGGHGLLRLSNACCGGIMKFRRPG